MQVREIVEKLREDYHVAGMSVAVVKDGEVVSADGYGLANVAENKAMTKDTVLPIGSITKSFTALALGMLVDEGKLDWDEPVKTYIPTLKLYNDLMTEHATTRDLLCHRTGVPRFDMLVAFDALDDRAKQVETFQYLQPNKAFRTTLQYSNQMVTLAGYLVDILSGMSYEEFVKERIFKPLGMNHTDFEVDNLKNYEDYAKGYVFAQDQFVEPPYLHLGALNPAGGIISNVVDMAKYAIFQMGDGTVNGERLIEEATLKEMHTHQMIGSPYFWQFDEMQSAEYGLAWFTDIYRGKHMISHGGNTNGYSAQLTLIPEDQFAMVALSNATSSFSVNALSHYLSDDELGVTDIPDWSARYQEIFNGMMGDMLNGMQARAGAKIPDTTTTKALEAYAGKYVHPGFGTIELAMTENGLVGNWNGFDIMMTHYHYDSFDMLLVLMGQPVPAEFVFDAAGNVESIKVVLEEAPGIEAAVFTKEA